MVGQDGILDGILRAGCQPALVGPFREPQEAD
jgi:hypothetical protein